jgi:hypothetical protein
MKHSVWVYGNRYDTNARMIATIIGACSICNIARFAQPDYETSNQRIRHAVRAKDMRENCSGCAAENVAAEFFKYFRRISPSIGKSKSYS